MRRDWLVYLVIFSLALNLGTIGAMVYFRYQPPPPPPPLAESGPSPGFWRVLQSLNLDPEQQQLLKHNFPAHRQQIKELRGRLQQQRQELFSLISQPQPNEAQVAAQITAINNLQNALEQEMARFLLDFKRQLRPEQQEVLLHNVRQRLCGPDCSPPGERQRGRGRSAFWPPPPGPEAR